MTLTKRETEVFKLAGDGLSVTEIGEELGIAANTVKTHLIHLRSKIGVSNKRGLVLASREFFTENNQ
jgi:ATP/maltotriose-dependent transcriptional regulator MalT